jgi:predicted house-cleaning noncanonical NTP pyrophosphatase (MazG superfamily)
LGLFLGDDMKETWDRPQEIIEKQREMLRELAKDGDYMEGLLNEIMDEWGEFLHHHDRSLWRKINAFLNN